MTSLTVPRSRIRPRRRLSCASLLPLLLTLHVACTTAPRHPEQAGPVPLPVDDYCQVLAARDPRIEALTATHRSAWVPLRDLLSTLEPLVPNDPACVQDEPTDDDCIIGRVWITSFGTRDTYDPCDFALLEYRITLVRCQNETTARAVVFGTPESCVRTYDGTRILEWLRALP